MNACSLFRLALDVGAKAHVVGDDVVRGLLRAAGHASDGYRRATLCVARFRGGISLNELIRLCHVFDNRVPPGPA